MLVLVPKRVFLASGHSLPMLAAAVHFLYHAVCYWPLSFEVFLPLGTGLDVLNLPSPDAEPPSLCPKPRKRVRGKEKMVEGSPGFRLSSSILLVLVLEDEGLDVTNCGVQSWIEVPPGCGGRFSSTLSDSTTTVIKHCNSASIILLRIITTIISCRSRVYLHIAMLDLLCFAFALPSCLTPVLCCALLHRASACWWPLHPDLVPLALLVRLPLSKGQPGCAV